MEKIKIHVFHTGQVCVAPALPFGGDNCNLIEASGLLTKKEDRLWLPVSSYLIEHPKGKFLVDTGWARDMSPDGKYDIKAQVKSLGSYILYKVNQGVVPVGKCIDEQLLAMGIKTCELDAVLLTHLDCDHANGLKQVKDAKRLMVSADEMRFAKKERMRYHKKWWADVLMEEFEWNGTQGPAGKSYDLLGNGSIQLINIPGHSDGMFAVKITGEDEKFVLLYADGGYSRRSWEEQVTSGISADKEQQKKSLQWIREQCMNENCIAAFANHDTEVKPQVVEL